MNSLTYPHTIRALLVRLGQKLAAARVAKGWSQAEIARRVGASRRTILNIEAGSPGAAIGTVLHLAWLLDVRVDDAPARQEPSARVRRRAAPGKSVRPVDLEF
ncbi:MAG: helix-turn-helix domain-containing protein [Nevskia sp.]|nr:helix-turn-helix domain-containing protein [Nevskia sp.]